VCKFLSAIVTRDGSVFCDPEHTDSHEDLIASLGLNDIDRRESADVVRHFVRVEFTSETLCDPDSYSLVLDDNRPVWWTDEMESGVAEHLRGLVRRMIVSGNRDVLLGGCWILVGGANVKEAINSRVVVVYGDGVIGVLYGSSRVGMLRDSSQVGVLNGSSRVDALYGSSRVGMLRDSSQVGVLNGSSWVGTLYGSSRVGMLYDSIQVENDLRAIRP
jgi:hypothetical protein